MILFALATMVRAVVNDFGLRGDHQGGPRWALTLGAVLAARAVDAWRALG